MFLVSLLSVFSSGSLFLCQRVQDNSPLSFQTEFTLMSFTHLVEFCASFYILPYELIKFDQHHLLEMLYFFQYCFQFIYPNSGVHRYADLCLGLRFDCIDQYICFHANIMLFKKKSYCSVIQHEAENVDTSSSSSVIHDYLSYPFLLLLFLGFLSFHIKLKIGLLISMKNYVGMIGIVFNLQVAFGMMGIFSHVCRTP